jgi:hypothetical protein
MGGSVLEKRLDWRLTARRRVLNSQEIENTFDAMQPRQSKIRRSKANNAKPKITAVRIRYTSAFGKNFERLNDEHLEDLFSLEREQAIYADHYIDELKDFRKVRIQFTTEEVKEYVRSLWAYELFLRAGSPRQASSVSGIPRDIARRADRYSGQLIDGRTLGPPWHCPAAFYGRELESLICSNRRAEVLQETGRKGFILAVKRVVDSITPAIRRFNERERGLASWPIACEDDVRDLIYVMLRAAISDIRTEEAVPSRSGTHKFADLASELAGVFIEVKWIGKKHQWRNILKQINDDIQSYFKHPACNTLVFLVVDAAKDIQDPWQFEKSISGIQILDGKEIEIMVFVRET